jgi:uncharacterized protein GlcG (DUF336 family)
METGQYPTGALERHANKLRGFCTPIRALFCVQCLSGGNLLILESEMVGAIGIEPMTSPV